jgi:hypothetical protein
MGLVLFGEIVKKLAYRKLKYVLLKLGNFKTSSKTGLGLLLEPPNSSKIVKKLV